MKHYISYEPIFIKSMYVYLLGEIWVVRVFIVSYFPFTYS